MSFFRNSSLFLALGALVFSSSCSDGSSYEHPVHGTLSKDSKIHQITAKECDLQVFTKDGIRVSTKGKPKTFTGKNEAWNYTLKMLYSEDDNSYAKGLFKSLRPYFNRYTDCMEEKGFKSLYAIDPPL